MFSLIKNIIKLARPTYLSNDFMNDCSDDKWISQML